MVEKWLLGQNRTRELCRFGRGVESWNLWTVPPGLALGATLWLEMLPQFYNYCQSEETMGGMRWLSLRVQLSTLHVLTMTSRLRHALLSPCCVSW